MGGPKRVMLAIVWTLLVLAATLSIWLASLKPEVREIIFRNLLGLSETVTQTGTRCAHWEINFVFGVGRDDLGAPSSKAQ